MSYYNTSGPSPHKYIDTSQPVWGIRAGMSGIPLQSIRGLGCGRPMGCVGAPAGSGLKCMSGLGDSGDTRTWAPSGFEYRNDLWWPPFASLLAQQVVTVADLQGGYFCTPAPTGLGGEMNGYGAVQTWAAAGWFVLHQYQGQKCVDGNSTAVIRVAPIDIGKWRGVPGVRILAMPGNAPSTQTEWAKYGYYDQPAPADVPPQPSPPVVIPQIPTVKLCPDGSFPDPFTMQCRGSSTPVVTVPPVPTPQVNVSASVEAPWKTALFVGIVAACVIGVAKIANKHGYDKGERWGYGEGAWDGWRGNDSLRAKQQRTVYGEWKGT